MTPLAPDARTQRGTGPAEQDPSTERGVDLGWKPCNGGAPCHRPDRRRNEARAAAGLSNAALARAIDTEPATVRRLFPAHQVNPTLGTLSEVAGALGMQITLTPLSDAERVSLTEPLLREDVAEIEALARHLAELDARPPALA